MKTRHSKPVRNSGSVLFITLILAAILGTTLGGYLLWVRSQNSLVAESQAWNSALALAEAGIEEGMAQINIAGTNFSVSASTNYGGPVGGPYGPHTNAIQGGGYSVIISNDYPPTIYSTGSTKVPYLGIAISRTVKVTTKTQPAFGNAMVSLQNVTMNGNNVMVDSYDSSSSLASTLGKYNPTNRLAQGDVTTTQGLLDVGNADIFGKMRTPPWLTNNYNLGPNGRVGDLYPGEANANPGWAPTKGLESGWYVSDFNATFPDAVAPYSVTSAPNPPYYNATNTYLLTGGDYAWQGDLSLKNTTVYVTGNSRLYVTGNITGNNNSSISIADGMRLYVYQGQPSGSPVSATFYTVNEAPGPLNNAYNFQFYGLPTCTSLTWQGNASYMGTVYAPEANFTLGGSGNAVTNDYQGACVVQSVNMNGHFNFHYDKNLQRVVFPVGWVVASWQEL